MSGGKSLKLNYSLINHWLPNKVSQDTMSDVAYEALDGSLSSGFQFKSPPCTRDSAVSNQS